MGRLRLTKTYWWKDFKQDYYPDSMFAMELNVLKAININFYDVKLVANGIQIITDKVIKKSKKYKVLRALKFKDY